MFDNFRKQTIYALSTGNYFCPDETEMNVCAELDGNFTAFAYVAKNDYYNLIYEEVGSECRSVKSGRTAAEALITGPTGQQIEFFAVARGESHLGAAIGDCSLR